MTTAWLPPGLYPPRDDGAAVVCVIATGRTDFFVDRQTLKVTPTNGYNGLGPPEPLMRAFQVDPQPYIYANALAKVKGTKKQ